MLYYILNRDFNIIEMIELYSSMIWTNRFWDVGDFELYLPATPKTVSLFSESIEKGYYVVSEKDLKHAMMPSKLNIETSRSDGNYLTVTGYDLKYILNRRIVWEYKNIGGEIEKELRKLVLANAIDPTNSDRKLPALALSDDIAGVTDLISGGLFGENLASGIRNKCKLYGCGWDVELDLENKRMLFKILKGVDRSETVMFSNDMDNLLTTKYTVDKSQRKNIAYVSAVLSKYNEDTKAYEPYDLSQIVTLSTTEGVPKEYDRYEMYVDNNESFDNSKYTTSQYIQILRENAKKSLRNAFVRDSVSGEVISNYTYHLDRDYSIGDIVSVKNEYGLTFRSRVTEVIISRASNKDTVIPSFEIIDNLETPDTIDPSTCRSVILSDGSEEYLVTAEGELVTLPISYSSDRVFVLSNGIQKKMMMVHEIEPIDPVDPEEEPVESPKVEVQHSARTLFDPDYDYKREEKSKWA